MLPLRLPRRASLPAALLDTPPGDRKNPALFPGAVAQPGQSVGLSIRRLRVRVPSASPENSKGRHDLWRPAVFLGQPQQGPPRAESGVPRLPTRLPGRRWGGRALAQTWWRSSTRRRVRRVGPPAPQLHERGDRGAERRDEKRAPATRRPGRGRRRLVGGGRRSSSLGSNRCEAGARLLHRSRPSGQEACDQRSLRVGNVGEGIRRRAPLCHQRPQLDV